VWRRAVRDRPPGERGTRPPAFRNFAAEELRQPGFTLTFKEWLDAVGR
jgi:hypothetical protein